MKTLELYKPKKIETQLNIAPLIDVMFLLLIFFALSTQFVATPGIEIQLPEAETAVPQKAHKAIIYVSADQEIFWNEQRIEIDDLGAEMKTAVSTDPDINIVIKADEKADIGPVVQMMDLAKKEKAKSIVISTKIAGADTNE